MLCLWKFFLPNQSLQAHFVSPLMVSGWELQGSVVGKQCLLHIFYSLLQLPHPPSPITFPSVCPYHVHEVAQILA